MKRWLSAFSEEKNNGAAVNGGPQIKLFTDAARRSRCHCCASSAGACSYGCQKFGCTLRLPMFPPRQRGAGMKTEVCRAEDRRFIDVRRTQLELTAVGIERQ